MKLRRLSIRCSFVVLALALAAAPGSRAAEAPGAPFAAPASVGPDASARINATVRRSVDGKSLTLPAALVPALEPGDVVSVQFSDYLRPPAEANYHVNVAFITEIAPQHWLFARSSPADRLFSNDRRHQPAAAPMLRFVYGTAGRRGIPIFFIVPEDGKTRGMDGVRDYVGAHPTDFTQMSESADDAAAKYVWFSDFLQSLAQGAIDPLTAQARVVSVATSLGASPAAVQACYAAGGTQGQIANCVQSALVSVQYQTNIEAPTAAQFFGGVAGAVSPAQIAFYLQPLLAMWHVFGNAAHQEYEYLPAVLELAGASDGRAATEVLRGAKVPTLRPPAARSSVLFFTIGDAQALAAPPVVTSDAGPAMCAQGDRVALPIHLDRTSPYVHDAALAVDPDRGASFTIPLDAGSLGAPVVDRARLDPSGTGETIRLTGRFGFDPLALERAVSVRIAVPNRGAWSVAAAPHRPPVAGGALDLIASSDQAPCLASADLQLGAAAPIPLTVKHLDDRRIELQASLAAMPPGQATVHFYQDDSLHHASIEDAAPLGIGADPARVAADAHPAVGLSDPFVQLTGSGFDGVTGLLLNGTIYAKAAASDAERACFTGPPIAGFQAGQTVSAQLLGPGNAPGAVFALAVDRQRPAIAVLRAMPDAATHLSTDVVRLVLSVAGTVPSHATVRLRHAVDEPAPCDAVDTATGADLPAADLHQVADGSLEAIVHAGEVLGDAAFGRLQVQLADDDAKLASRWADVPGAFVRAPVVVRIECPNAAAALCTLVGTGLTSIDAIGDGSGPFVAPDFTCATAEKGFACVRVPHLARYVVRLGDRATTEALPLDLITGVRPAPAPSPG
jgi:hypothetical protein